MNTWLLRALFAGIPAGVLFLLGLVFAAGGLAGTDQWTTTGPYNGYFPALAFSPQFASDHTIFAGSDGGYFGLDDGDLYVSTNGGSSWAPTTIENWPVTAVAFSPDYANDHTLFVGVAAQGHPGPATESMFISTDGGSSWSWNTNGLAYENVTSLTVSPSYATDHTVFAGTELHGVFKSTDGGSNWSQVNNGFAGTNYAVSAMAQSGYEDCTYPNGVRKCLFQPVIFAAITDAGLFESTDGGNDWSPANAGFGGGNIVITSLAVSPGFPTDRTMFAATESGVYKSTDGGNNWFAVNMGITDLNVDGIAVSPGFASDGAVFASTNGGGVFKSTDGGESWCAVNNGMPTQLGHSVAVSPDFDTDHVILSGTNGGGVYSYAFSDMTPPQVSSVRPGTGSFLNMSWTVISAAYTDAGSGIDTGSVIVTLDGKTLPGCRISATSVSCPVSGLSEGAHVIGGSVADTSGNTALITGSFSVDTTPPEVSVASPSGNIYAAATSITADFSDAGSGVNAASVSLSLDGIPFAPGACSVSANSASCSATGLAVGQHTIGGSVSDNAGNSSPISGSFNVVDIAAPTVEYSGPAGTTANQSPTVTGTVSDPAPSAGIDTASGRLSLDGGTTWPYACSISGGSISCPVTDRLNGSPATTYQARIKVSDRATPANTGESAITQLTVDAVGPTVSNVQPSGDINTNSPIISADYTDAAGISPASASISLDGVWMPACNVTATSISCPAAGLAPGSHTIGGSVADTLGNVTFISGSFTVDAGGRPALVLGAAYPFWSSYDDFQARRLSVDWTVFNFGGSGAYHCQLTGDSNSSGVVPLTGMPMTLGNGTIAADAAVSFNLEYSVPPGVSWWRAALTASVQGADGTGYTYP